LGKVLPDFISPLYPASWPLIPSTCSERVHFGKAIAESTVYSKEVGSPKKEILAVNHGEEVGNDPVP